MSYSIKDLKNLVNSDEFKTFKIEDNRLIKLGEKIYGRRKDLSLTQSELSELSAIPQNKISQLESGTYWEPWRDILERLSVALEIDLNYFLLDSIDRKTFEVYNYILPRITIHEEWRLQMIKIPYFIDLEAFQEIGRRITNFRYIRYQYGPFDSKLYSYSGLFFGNEKGFRKCNFTYLHADEISIIDKVLSNKPVNNGNELKRLSYETYPMKKIWATMRGGEWWREELVF